MEVGEPPCLAGTKGVVGETPTGNVYGALSDD
jgi:hypothetical protein